MATQQFKPLDSLVNQPSHEIRYYKGPPAQKGQNVYRHYMAGYPDNHPVWAELRQKFNVASNNQIPPTMDKNGDQHFIFPGPILRPAKIDLSNHPHLKWFYGT